MNVDGVIARHMSRLEEHRKFLEESGTIGASASQDSVTPNAHGTVMERILFPADGATPSPNPFTPLMGEKLFQMQSPTIMNQPHLVDSRSGFIKGRGKPKDTCRLSEGHVTSRGHTERPLHARHSPAHAGKDTPRHVPSRVVRAESPRRPGTGPTGIHERLAAEDRRIDEQLRAAGRYGAALDPDGMYVMSQLWLEGRERSRQVLVDERMRSAMEECPFRPQRAHKDKGKGKGKEKEGVAARSRSSRAGVGLHCDAGVAAHLERHEEARQQRAEAERRATGSDGNGWRNEQTVPRAFVFSRKVASIPALRKPLSAPPARRSGGRAEERGGMQSAPHALEDPCAADGTQAPGGGEEAVERAPAPRSERAHALAAKEKYQQEIITRLEKQIAERDRQMEEQRGEMKLLQRELEVAKSAVRRLTLQDASQPSKEVTVVEMK